MWVGTSTRPRFAIYIGGGSPPGPSSFYGGVEVSLESAEMGVSQDLQRLVCELVAIESVNPDLVATGSGESRIADFVALWLTQEGLSAQILEPVPGRKSVVGVLAGSGGGASL